MKSRIKILSEDEIKEFESNLIETIDQKERDKKRHLPIIKENSEKYNDER